MSIQPPQPVGSSSIAASTGSTSSAPQPAGSTSAVATLQPNPVAVAQRKLFKSAVDNLWEEKVTNSGWFTWITGIALAKYFWNRRTAKADDKAFGATIADLNNKAVALVNAVAQRGLTAHEAATANREPVSSVTFNNVSDQLDHAGRIRIAEVAEKEFYEVFKTRCKQLNVNAELGIYSNAALSHLDTVMQPIYDKAAKENKGVGHRLYAIKMETVKKGFGERIYKDMIQAYAELPIAQITPDSYKAKVAELKGHFNENDPRDIEATLRQALLKHHKDAFSIEADIFTNASPQNQKVAGIKDSLKKELEKELAAYDAELTKLRGSTGFNGSIDEATRKRDAARTALDTARTAFINAFRTQFSTVDGLTADQMLGLDFRTCPEPLQKAQADLKQKNDDFKAAEAELKKLTDKLNELATYDVTGTRTGGKAFEVDQKLIAQTLDGLARVEATKMGNFYQELNTPVLDTTASARARYSAMHGIIGN